VDLRCAWTSFLSEEILGCILPISLNYASCVSGYNTSTRYRLGSLSIHGLLEIYCTGSIAGGSRSRQRFSCSIDCKLFIIDDSVNIPNSFGTLVSGAPEIYKQHIIGIKLGSSGAPDHTDVICRLQTQIPQAAHGLKISRDYSSTDSHTVKFTALHNITQSSIKLAHLLFITYWFIQMRLWFSLPDISLPLPLSHNHHYNHLTRNGIKF